MDQAYSELKYQDCSYEIGLRFSGTLKAADQTANCWTFTTFTRARTVSLISRCDSF